MTWSLGAVHTCNGALGDAHAASLTASERVGCAWQVRARSSAEAAELHQHRALVDHLAGVAADDVDTQHPVGRRIGQDLHEAVGVAGSRARPLAVNGNLPDLVGDAGLLQLSSVLPTEATSGPCRPRPG